MITNQSLIMTPQMKTNLSISSRLYLGMRNETCGCTELYGKPYREIVNYDEIIKYRESREEVDIVIESPYFVHRNRGKETQDARKRNTISEILYRGKMCV